MLWLSLQICLKAWHCLVLLGMSDCFVTACFGIEHYCWGSEELRGANACEQLLQEILSSTVALRHALAVSMHKASWVSD